ncbi:MAG: shikimate dehydrogenase, partial [Proteobacteria bacterium]|nr:shikimate dehydrogenase [Pseudomonadota bacterium]
MEYRAILVELGGFAAAARAFRAAGGKGLNVTIPFKRDAWVFADLLSARAERAGAVNTLRFESTGVRGDNTDGPGLVRDLKINHGYTLAGRRILLLGAGGAARGVLQPLLAEKPAQLIIANRTPSKAAELALHFGDL